MTKRVVRKYCVVCEAIDQECCGNKYYNTQVNDDYSTADISLLGEGNTPLIRSKSVEDRYGLGAFYFKNEMLNPTGSFKDRETSFVFQKIIAPSGGNKIAIASSGNAAISACMYAKKTNIVCQCYVSEGISASKLDFLKLLGAEVNIIPGVYKDTYEFLVDNLEEGVLNITSGQIEGRENGNMAIIEEIYSTSLRPTHFIVPVGNGSLLYGLYKGLVKMKKQNVIFSFPKLIGVEIDGNAPVDEAIKQNKPFVSIERVPDTIADAGIAAQDAYCAPKAIHALKETGGKMVLIKEEDILSALKDIIDDGLLPEPSSACVVAALKYLPELSGQTVVAALKYLPELSGQTVVAVLTGSGDKMVKKIIELLA